MSLFVALHMFNLLTRKNYKTKQVMAIQL